MNTIDIRDMDLNEDFFHFTIRENLEIIEKEGLKAQVGNASKMIGDNEKRVYISRGGKGLLKAKDTFIFEFKNLNICDIPVDYRKYFNIDDYSSEEKLNLEDLYIAMKKRFEDEVYLKVDAVEGVDYLEEDINSLWGMEHDIKCKENCDIDASKLSLVISEKGNSALDIIQYIYDEIIKRNPDKEEVIKEMFYDLINMLEYINHKI